jgi:hypothetical protein
MAQGGSVSVHLLAGTVATGAAVFSAIRRWHALVRAAPAFHPARSLAVAPGAHLAR